MLRPSAKWWSLALGVAAAFLVVAQLGFAGPATSASGSETIDGVPLVPAPHSQLNDCQKLANHLHRTVPCPGLVPKPIPLSPAMAATYCSGVGSCGPAYVWVNPKSLAMTQMNFEVPAGYVGVSIETYNGSVPATSSTGGALGHFVFETGPNLVGEYKPHSDKAASSIPSYCKRISGKADVRVNGSDGTYYQCADSSSDRNAIETIAGHDMLQWVDQGMITQVSFHGHSQVNLDLDLKIANSVVLVRPRR